MNSFHTDMKYICFFTSIYMEYLFLTMMHALQQVQPKNRIIPSIIYVIVMLNVLNVWHTNINELNFSPNSFPKCAILHFSCPIPFVTLEWTTWFWIIFSCEELSPAQFKNPHPTSHPLSSRSLEGWEWRGCVRPHSSLKHRAGEAVLSYGLGPPSHQCLTAQVLNTRKEKSGIRGNFSPLHLPLWKKCFCSWGWPATQISQACVWVLHPHSSLTWDHLYPMQLPEN